MGKAIIFSAPSGSGKTTIVHEMLNKVPSLGFSISATTRKIRDGKEVDGKDYYFFSVDEFKSKVGNGEFIEWEEVYPDIMYGTLKLEVERLWREGKHVVFDVDVEGGVNLKKYFKDDALAIFIKAPSVEALKERLKARNTETKETLAVRIDKAKHEFSYEEKFDVTVVNDNLGQALASANKLILDFISKE